MAIQDRTVADDWVVSMHYTLHLDDQIIDSSDGQEPLEFLQGHGQIISGLEQALYSLTVGDEKKVVVAPADGYGDVDPDAFQRVPRDIFPANMELALGMGLRMRDAETDDVVAAHVAELTDDDVLLDLNHPLAGKTLHFQVKIVGLRPATSEELQHGHVHGDMDEH